MKPEKLTNRELDEMGKRLIVAAKADDGEIDRLVSSPRLYDGVLAKIAAADRPVREPKRPTAWRPAVITAMVVALLSVPLLAFLKYSGVNEPPITRQRSKPYEVKERPFVPDVPQPERTADERDDDDQPRPIPAVVRTNENRQRQKPRKQPAAPVHEPEPAFVPIGLTERAVDATIDGRVVRVEMPRSALFALGVDLPLENGTRAVKADLLLGTDGTPRGIRLVE